MSRADPITSAVNKSLVSNQPVDLLLHNARVLTMDRLHPQAEAVAVQGNQILSLDESTVTDQIGPHSTIIDCEGHTVIPGFIDAHTHLFSYAASLLSVNCTPDMVDSIEDIKRAIRSRAVQLPKGSWIRAQGFEEFDLKEKRPPTRWELDEATPDHPVKLIHRSGHASVLNSLGLAQLGITQDTKEPLGGEISRDLQTGELTGYLLEMESTLETLGAPTTTAADLHHGLNLAFHNLLSLGVTSVHDATPTRSLQQWDLLQERRANGLLPLRLSKMIGPGDLAEVLSRGLTFGAGDDWLQIGAVKFMLNETDERPLPTQDILRTEVSRAHEAGFQVALHSVQENGLLAAIDAIEYALARSPRDDHRHRIEHCGVCPPHLIGRLAELEIGVVTQPSFIRMNGDRYQTQVAKNLHPNLYRCASLLAAGVRVSFGSDCPVVSPTPALALAAAVDRSGLSGRTLGTNEAVSIITALELHTKAGAWIAFQQTRKGMLRPGFLADMVILRNDPTTMAIEDLDKLRVEKTIIGGQVAWERQTGITARG